MPTKQNWIHHSISLVFHPWDGFWVNFWTAGTTFGTLALALATFAVIKQTRGESEANERHHRDLFKPILILEDIIKYQGILAGIESPPLEYGVLFRFEFPCLLKNIGLGVALKLQITGHIDGLETAGLPIERPEPSFETLSPVENSMSYYFLQSSSGLPRDIALKGTNQGSPDKDQLVFEYRLSTRAEGDVEKIFQANFFVTISYRDIYGTEFKTVYSMSKSRLIGTGSHRIPGEQEYSSYNILLTADKILAVGI